ncbi:MAG: hypothetical protein K9H49_16895 [Bacteroidales bacterium]|nr:hypothetical protein [Bacteroidales bacterium]MCF8405976.1 hypothetical protein [Bacteroidales bacterium]
MKRFFYYYRLFSIDIIAGALASCLFAFKIIDVQVSVPLLFVLAISVFSIYSLDHVIDGIRKEGMSDTGSHRYFFLHRKVLLIIVIFTILSGLGISFFYLSLDIIKFGIFAATLLSAYFLFNQIRTAVWKKLFIKEFWIASIYTLVIWGLPFVESNYSIAYSSVFLAISFGFLVLGNVLIYSYFGFFSDRSEHEKSIAIQFGRRGCRILIFLVLGISFSALLTEILVFHHYRILDYSILFLMNFGLLFIINFEEKFERDNLYGVYADALFLLPVLSVL